jgi:hypothetical protein
MSISGKRRTVVSTPSLGLVVCGSCGWVPGRAVGRGSSGCGGRCLAILRVCAAVVSSVLASIAHLLLLLNSQDEFVTRDQTVTYRGSLVL